ncbi:nucleotidyltransferase domain-containing protein [Thermococcus sp.]
MLSKLFTTERRVRLLSSLLEKDTFGVEEVARELKISKGTVSSYLKELIEGELVKKEGRRFRWADENARRELKMELNYWTLRGKFLPLRKDWILALGVYGSFARGENREDSDLDVWILVEKEEPLKVAELQEKLESLTGRKVDLLVLTPKRLNRFKAENPYLYWTIKLASLILWGSLNEV